MIDNNDIEYILGIQIRRNRQAQTPSLSQDKYILDVLRKFNRTTCKPVVMPLEAGIRFSRTEAENLTPDQTSLMASIPYAQAIGSLQYLVTCTRSDLGFPVNHLAQFMANPGPSHWTALKRIFRYLQHTSTWGLLYKSPSTPISDHLLCGWSDADWVGDTDTRWSTSSYIFQLHGALISWQNKKQSVVALSSTEAKVWLQTYSLNLVTKLNYPVSSTMTISRALLLQRILSSTIDPNTLILDTTFFVRKLIQSLFSWTIPQLLICGQTFLLNLFQNPSIMLALKYRGLSVSNIQLLCLDGRGVDNSSSTSLKFHSSRLQLFKT
jgi:hypothetical protein